MAWLKGCKCHLTLHTLNTQYLCVCSWSLNYCILNLLHKYKSNPLIYICTGIWLKIYRKYMYLWNNLQKWLTQKIGNGFPKTKFFVTCILSTCALCFITVRSKEHFLPCFVMHPQTRSSFCRHRKDELERRMSALQESRRELMVQLEGLMRLLKVRRSPVFRRFMCDKKASESVLIS